MIKSKKAAENWSVSDAPFWIVFTVVLGFAAIIYSIMLLSVGEGTARIRGDIENYFLVERFLKSENCFALYDNEIKRTYSGVLYHQKFTDAQLNTCMNGLDYEKSAFRLTLSSSDQTLLPVAIKTNNWNDKSPAEKRQTKMMQIFYLNNYYNGEMIIETQNIK